MEVTFQRQFNVVRQCRHGQMLCNCNDMYIGRSLELYGEYSPAEAELLGRLVRAGDAVMEVGANIGAHTLFLAQAVMPGGYVVAIEPQRMVFQTLCANMALNSVMNVICLQAAAGEKAGTVSVPVLDPMLLHNSGGLELGAEWRGEAVQLIPLDSLKIASLRLLKVDVEGMEAAVLRGARGLIEKFRPVMYVENDRKEKERELVELIGSMGYAMYLHRPALFSPKNFRGNTENVFGKAGSVNLLCLPEGVRVDAAGLEPIGATRSLPH